MRILQICDVVGAGAGGARPTLRSEASASLTGAPTAVRIDSDCEPDHSILHPLAQSHRQIHGRGHDTVHLPLAGTRVHF
ncbi:hypothetical protein A2T55_13400 [Brevibacterium linens]|uniref:Uncharacterized protein n=1 Tax=Brevibacterium linens TaxID=1703 RepID=A0A142NPW0_BRELN|nr:hypothetical protein A2T55_13400 [Brevibacterium linens]